MPPWSRHRQQQGPAPHAEGGSSGGEARTASDVFTTPHEEPHTKRMTHEDASMEELVEYGDDEVKEGPTIRVHSTLR